MYDFYCNEYLKYYPSDIDAKDLRPSIMVNCILNNWLTHTAIMLNIVTIYAIHRSSMMAKPLKMLLMNLAFSDVAVGLLGQPFYTKLLVMWLQRENPSCNAFLILSISVGLFSTASFLGVVAVSVDRLLAIHLHLRYQELVTFKRVVAVVIFIWVYSAFVSSIILWGQRSTRDIITFVNVIVGFILTFVIYIKIYLTIRRHKNQMQSVQIREAAQSDEVKNFAALIKSTVGIFYIYLGFKTCYLPSQVSSVGLRFYGPSIVLKRFHLFSVTLIFLNSSLNPVIYCWKMKHVRRAFVDILRKMSRRRN